MKQFTIFKDFHRVSAEMTEEEVVSSIGNVTYKEKVEEIRHLFAEQGKDAANEKKKELPGIAFSANYKGGRRDIHLVRYLGDIVIDIDQQDEEQLTRILPLIKGSIYTRIAFISPKGMGVKIIAHCCHPDGTLPETLQEIKDFHKVAYTKLASFYAQLCQVPIDTSGQDVGRVCLFSYDPDVYFNPNAQVMLVEQPPLALKYSKKKKESEAGQQSASEAAFPNDDTTLNNCHQISLMATLNYFQSKTEKYIEGNRNNYLYHLACLYNQYGVLQEEAQLFIKAHFSDFPSDEAVLLTNNAYTHTHEFDTRKLNPTQTRILRIEQYIYEHYETRYNEVIHIMEYRKKQPGAIVHETEPYRILDEMMENSIWAEANERGLACHVGTIQNLIYSNFSISYHPIREYFDNLPAWDGIDYIRILADSVQTTHQDFWIECLKRYLVAMCAAAMNDDIVNHTVLLLCSEIQNIGKTTFINNLLPPELRMYLSTGLINPNNKDDLAKVAQAMLINLDEFEGMSGRDLNAFKDLVTRKVISFRLPYAHRSQNFPHIASFAGTCNGQEILHDTTGNRRFLCFHVNSMTFIDINYAQMYAQIKYLLSLPDFQYWFTQADNARIEENNEGFVFHSPEEELVLTHIRKPERFDKVYYLTVSEIAELIRERTGYQYNVGSKIAIGKVMNKHQFEYRKGRNGRRYSVYIIDTEQVKTNRLYE